MTKVMLTRCCTDIVAPLRAWQSNEWRYCQCGQSAVRWRDPSGQLEVTARDLAPLVIGLNNSFIEHGLALGRGRIGEEWRELHEREAHEVPSSYLFNEARRNCWALLVHPGDSGDVHYLRWDEAIPA